MGRPQATAPQIQDDFNLNSPDNGVRMALGPNDDIDMRAVQ